MNTINASINTFEKLSEILFYLQSNNWKISMPTLYRHQEKGFIRPDENGLYSLGSVHKYANECLKRKLGAVIDDVDDVKKKRKFEAEKVEIDAKLKQKKLDILNGKYVLRNQYEKDLANRAKFLRTDLLNFPSAYASDLIELVEGNQEKKPDLILFMREAILDYLNRYAG